LRVLQRARDAGLASALYGAGEFFRRFAGQAERYLRAVASRAPPKDREEGALRQRLEDALEVTRTVRPRGQLLVS